ncbi:hypothetical protein GP486_008576, partial [Trichoglossum hirsutum]
MPAPQITVSGPVVECEGISANAASRSVALNSQPDVPNGQSSVTPVSPPPPPPPPMTEADPMSAEHGGQISRIHLADAGPSSSSEGISSGYSPHDQAMDTAVYTCACACACALCSSGSSSSSSSSSSSVSDGGQEFTAYRQATTDGCSIQQRQHEQQHSMAASPPESEASTPPREFSGASSPTLSSSFLLSLTNVPTWSAQTFLFGQAMLTPPSMADHDEVFHMEQQQQQQQNNNNNNNDNNNNNSDDEFPSIVPLPSYEDIDMEQSPDSQDSSDNDDDDDDDDNDRDGVAIGQSGGGGFLETDTSFADYPSSESSGTHSSSSSSDDADDDSVMSDLRDIEPEFDGFGDDDYSSIFGSDGSETVVNEVPHSSDPPPPPTTATAMAVATATATQGVPQAT